jgi:ABC-type transport system involved in multi-copper enzyme maturation permease subunit
MTTLTAYARPEKTAGLRPVPWRRMIWVTWRQHRTALTGVAAFLGVLAAYMLVTGLQLHHAYATSCHPASSLACTVNFTGRYATSTNVLRAFLQVVPAVIGAFAGAPVLAREMESGTFRFAWTQGFGRWRWTLAKLVLLAVVVTAAAGAFTALFTWYADPFFAAGYAIPFSTDIFDLMGVSFAAWTLTAFAIGVLAGMLIRRAVPAIAATLVAYGGLAAATALWLRQHYMTPLVSKQSSLPGSAWAVGQWFTKDGKFAFTWHSSQLVNAVQTFCPSRGPGSQQVVSPAQCLAPHGYVYWTAYQPGSRFWPFQWIEGGWLLVLSVLLIAAAVWLVRRRAA